jgi:integrase
MVYSIRKNGNKYKVYDEGRKTLASFDTKEQAIAWTTKPSTIDFTQAFNLFNQNIDNQVNNGIIKKHTGQRYQEIVSCHIQPLILNIPINTYKYSDFLNNYLVKLSMAVSQTTMQPLSAKTYKDVIAVFRMVIKYIRDLDYDIGDCIKILEYRTKVPANKKNIIKNEFYTTSSDAKLLIQSETNLKYKTLYCLALVSGARTNELLAACYSNFKNNTWTIQNTLDNDNVFEPGSVKTIAGYRTVDITPELNTLIKSLKLLNLSQDRLFDISKSQVKYHTQKLAASIGIAWQGGLSPFRKLSSSLVFDSNVLSEKEFRQRYGWEDLKTFRKYYQRQTRNNARVDGIFNKLIN